MAQPFTNEQRDAIRARLMESARRHAQDVGLRKTSLDALTADAGISKSSFYKFFESKEQLFLLIAMEWEGQILAQGAAALACCQSPSGKARAAAFVYAAFEAIHQLGIARFLREDLPLLDAFISRQSACAHCIDSASSIFLQLRQAGIAFTAPEETVLSVIQLLYLSILSIGEVGDAFFPALRELVISACDRLVAA